MVRTVDFRSINEGSIPFGSTINCGMLAVVASQSHKLEVAGSSPAPATNGRVDNWLSSGLENRRSYIWVVGSNPISSAINYPIV